MRPGPRGLNGVEGLARSVNHLRPTHLQVKSVARSSRAEVGSTGARLMALVMKNFADVRGCGKYG